MKQQRFSYAPDRNLTLTDKERIAAYYQEIYTRLAQGLREHGGELNVDGFLTLHIGKRAACREWRRALRVACACCQVPTDFPNAGYFCRRCGRYVCMGCTYTVGNERRCVDHAEAA